MALSALWPGREPIQIATPLADALLAMLRAAFVLVRLNDPEGGQAIEIARVDELFQRTAQAREISAAIDDALHAKTLERTQGGRLSIGTVDLSVASAPLGSDGAVGVVLVGSANVEFPAQTERLLLDVAANQAAIGLQHARLLSEQKRYAAEVDQSVALRSSELAAAHARLKQEVVERRQVEDALRERERESRVIVDSLPGLVAILTPTGQLADVNNRLVEYCGRSKDELQEWATNDIVHPDDRSRIIQLFAGLITSGLPSDWESRLRRSDGVYRWFQFRALPLHDSAGHIGKWYALLTDIDDLKRAEAELRRAHEHLTEAQRLSQTGSFTVDAEKDELFWSDEHYRICEFELGSPVSIRRLREIVHPEDDALISDTLRRAMTGTDLDFHFRIVTSSGVLKHLRGIAHRIADRPVFVGAIQDITASKMAQAALNKAGVELAHVSRVTSLSALTASIAHEVNQPLSGIMTNAGTCLRMLDANPPNIDGARETARRTIRDGTRASEVVTRLRALFTKREFALEPLDLNEATREIIALTASDLQRNRIIVHSELADDLPTVAGDRVQLQQVILNLIRNASDAMVDVQDRPRQLLVKTEPYDGGRVRLAVRDAGIGLPPESLGSLFDAFYTTKSDGMGIGLFVSRSIIERHQGQLWAEPNSGSPGSTFAFVIPQVSTTT